MDSNQNRILGQDRRRSEAQRAAGQGGANPAGQTPRQRQPASQSARPRQDQRRTRRPAEKAPQPEQRPRRRRTAPSQRPAEAARREKRERQTGRTRPRQERTPRRPAPDVVYTPPQPFNRGRLLLHLVTIVAVVLALTFGMSIFLKVETVTVSGMDKYTAWDVMEASGINQGDNLLTFGEARACARIRAELPYVDSVRIGIKLPDTVNIEIKELDVLYAVRDQSNQWWLITAGGRVVEQVDNATAGQYTQIVGVQLSLPLPNEQAEAFEADTAAPADSTEATAASGAVPIVPPVTVPASEQLNAALSILQYLEDNGIIGQMASVDVTDISQIEMWYGQQYQVRLGDTTQLSYKVSCMKAAIAELDIYDSGILDISFTVWPDQVGYTAF